MQSINMDSDWAAERLNQIRTLMDRSASYRRSLAPTTLLTGIIGLAAAWLGWTWKIENPKPFILYWLCTALLALSLSLLILRHQSLRSAEPFWSIPTRRIAEAMCPAFLVGLSLTLASLCLEPLSPKLVWSLPSLWMTFYGCGLYAAGFFMPRGIKLFGMGFVATGCLTLFGAIEPATLNDFPDLQHAHLVMGGTFGVFHITYGIYLYLTEPRDPSP